MAGFEYAQWTEYLAFKGAFFKGEPVFTVFFTTATGEIILQSSSLLEALNEVGTQGWADYRIDVASPEPTKRINMPAPRITHFAKRYGFVPGASQLEATRWFRKTTHNND